MGLMYIKVPISGPIILSFSDVIDSTSRSAMDLVDMSKLSRRTIILIAIAAAGLVTMPAALSQSPNDFTRTAGGMTVYIGIVPAEILRDDPTMHGGKPAGHRDHHIVVAIFDTTSATRISDAKVKAKVSGLGLSGPEKTLEPMDIADTITYGGYLRLPGADIYTIRLTIRRPGSPQPVVMDFEYDHFDP